LGQINNAPKIVEELVKVKAEEAMSPLRKKLDEFLASQRNTRRLPLRDCLSRTR